MAHQRGYVRPPPPSVEQLAGFLDLAPAFLRDLEGRITYWAAGATRLFGYTAGEVLGRSADEVLSTVFPFPRDQIHEELLRTGWWDGELRQTCRDGRRIWVASHWALDRGEDGQARAVLETSSDITAAVEARESLRNTGEHLQHVLRGSPVAVYACDAELRYTWAINPQRGVRAEDLIGHTAEELLPPGAAAEITAFKRSVLETGRGARREFVFDLPGRGSICMDISAYPVTTPDGRISGLTMAAVDVTERWRERQALAEASERLHWHVANSPLAAIEFDTNSRILAWSAGAERIFGWTAAEVTGKTIEDLHWVFEDDATQTNEIRRQMREGATTTISRNRNYTKYGKVVHCEWYNSVLRGDDGGVKSLFSLVLDVTGRWKAEEAQRASEERLRLALTCSRALVFTHDRDLRYTWYNNWLPHGPKEVLGKTDLELFPVREEAERVLAIKRSVLKSGVSRREEFSVTIGSGRLWFDLMVEPIREPGGEITGVICAALDITERKLSEEILRTSEKRFRSLIESNTFGVVLGTFAGDTLYANAAMLRMLGYTREELAQGLVRWDQVTAPESLEMTRRARQELLETGATDPFEKEYIRKDGSRVPAILSLAMVEDPFGAEPVLVGFCLDLTEIRRAQDAQRRSDLRFRRLFESGVIGVGFAGRDGRILEINDALMRMIGYSQEEIAARGLRFADITPPEYAAQDAMLFAQVEQFGYSTPHEKEYVRKDGRRVPVLIATAAVDAETRLGVVVDLSERNRTMAALRASEDRLQLAAQAAGIGICDWDAEADLSVYNDELARMLGVDPHFFRGSAGEWLEAIHPDDREKFRQSFLDHSARQAESWPYQYRILRADGSVRWIEQSAKVYYGADGRVSRVIGTHLDVTERRHTEEVIRQKQKLESIGLLAGGIAHDFNNLLVGMLGGASYLREMLPRDHPASGVVELIEKSSEQAAHLTRQLLAYAGKGRHYLETLDLGRAVHDTCRMLWSSIPSHVKLTIETEGGTAPVRCDAGQLHQLVMNLVLNAAEAVDVKHPGEIVVKTGMRRLDQRFIREHLRGTALEAGEFVTLQVNDTGAGMSAATMARIFDPFFTTKFTGRGLGLAAVQGIVRSSGGAIEVSSEVGRGSTFTVYLPPAPVEGAPASKPPDTPPPPPEIRKGTVLVIDDEEIVARVFETALARTGYHPLIVTDGAAGLELFRQYADAIALVILDLKLPGMDGAEVLRGLHEIRADVPILITSGFSEEEAARTFAGEEIAGFLPKPFTVENLRQSLRKVLG